MRASELRGLTWRNVNFDEAIIHVCQRADAWLNIGPPKSAAATREIPLTPMTVNALRQWWATCPTGELGLVFPNGAGNIESHTNITKRVWNPLQQACGLVTETGKPRYGFHSLRHAAATNFITHLNWTPKRVQVVMGHSSIVMTYDRYAGWFEDKAGDREGLKKLEAAILAA